MKRCNQKLQSRTRSFLLHCSFSSLSSALALLLSVFLIAVWGVYLAYPFATCLFCVNLGPILLQTFKIAIEFQHSFAPSTLKHSKLPSNLNTTFVSVLYSFSLFFPLYLLSYPLFQTFKITIQFEHYFFSFFFFYIIFYI